MGSYNNTEKKKKKMRGLYKKPRLLIGTSSGYAQLQKEIQYELEGQYMDITKVHTRGRKEEGERRAPNKAGPMRPPLLNGIKLKGINHGIYIDIFLDR